MGHDHSHADLASKNIAFAFFLNFFFALIEVAGGILTNSIAIMSDAIHDFGDSLSLGVAWYLQRVSKKKGDGKYSYGYKRFSLLGSVFISLVLVVGSLLILWESFQRFSNPQQIDASGMVVLAVLGILVNGAAVIRLKKGKSHNEKAVFLHMMEDVLGWVAVLIGGVIMHFWELPFVDPLLSVLISLWVLSNVYRNLSSTISIMLQHVPETIDISLLEKEFGIIENSDSVHDLHVWSLDGENHVLSVHLVMKEGVTMDDINRAKMELKEIAAKNGIGHVTIEVESSNEVSKCRYFNEPC